MNTNSNPDLTQSESQILVRPAGPLTGEVEISGAKNSALKLMVATTLTAGTFRLKRVPRISDVETMAELLRSMGSKVEWAEVETVAETEVENPSTETHTSNRGEGTPGENITDEMIITTPENLTPIATYELVRKIRASVLVLAPLLVRCGEAEVALPGGDNLGPRPVDMHLDILKNLGAEIDVSHGNIRARVENLIGARVVLDIPSVGATETAMMAGAGAKGMTTIENAAREPEVIDLAGFLNRMGIPVLGAGTSTITVEGAKEISPTDHKIIPDRIEAATFLSALGIAGGEIILKDARYEDMTVLCHKFGEMGMRISHDSEGIWAMFNSQANGHTNTQSNTRLQSTDVSTLPYPGVPTDALPLIVSMLATADGVSIVTENLFDSRFGYMDELVRMGADIRTEGQHAVIRGKDNLSGSPVKATDIRAGAALVCAGLSASGETQVSDIHHIDRGYENLVGKLRALGADIRRLP